MTAGHLCVDLSQGAVPALLPFFISERHLSYAAAATIVFAATAASSVVQPVFGQLADRYAASWLMPAGLLAAGAGLALSGIVSSYGLILLAIALGGAGVAAYHPVAARLVGHLAAERRATGMSVFAVGGNAGFAFGPLLTTAVLLAFGLRGALLLMLPMVALTAIIVAQNARFASLSQGAATRPGEGAASRGSEAWGPFALLTAAIICRSITFYGLNTFLPLYWINVLHQSTAAGSAALTILLVAGIVGTLVGGRLADRYGGRAVVLAGMAALVPLLGAFLALGNVIGATLLLLPVGLALYAPSSVMVVMGQEYLPNRVGVASGVTLGLAITFGGLATPLLGRIADHYGLHAALTVLALLPLLAAALAFTLPRPARALAGSYR